jgi:selenide,water dikinase
MEETKIYLLTEYAHGAGCGCKIAPAVLQEILGTATPSVHFENLLVGHGTNDDAAVVDLGNGTALIATADFFMPIVDDAFDFGRVAAANAISDVYAMGGKPLLALALLGWPVDKLPPALAARVMEGARSICAEAGIPLAGGHSIDTTEPLFGLSVNGLVPVERVKRNATANTGDLIYLTKAIGTGILSTAGKRKLLKEEDRVQLVQQLVRLNSFGAILGQIPAVTAITDVTGFGILGHLSEICKGSGLSAELQFSAVLCDPLTERT